MNRFAQARLAALFLPFALIAGALGSQFIGHLYPCEMCHWQRWPHYAAIGLAALAFVFPEKPLGRILVALAIVGILISGGIGVFHAGVEYRWWPGITRCAATMSSTNPAETLEMIMNTPMIQCDQPQWTFHGISLAGFNAIISILGGLGIIGLWARRP